MRLSVLLPLTLLTLVVAVVSSPFTSNTENDVSQSIDVSSNTIRTGSSASNQFYGQRFLITLISHIFEMLNIKEVVQNIKEGRATETTCYVCKFGMALTQHFIEFGKGRKELGSLAYTICTTLHVEDKRVCKGIVDVYMDEFITVISQLAFSPNEICGIILGNTCAEVYNPLHNWTVPLTPFPKPPIAPSRKGRSLTGPTTKILHISDTHVDLQYTAGGDAVCSEPLCCRAASKNLPLAKQSGYWGDYRNCDIPLRTLEAMLKNIQQNHLDIDYVIWTGDIPPHDIWNQTREGQLSLLRQISILITKYLGSVPIYPALGNHESVPVNSFPPPNVKGSYSVSWLYDVLAEVWSNWLPQDTLKTIRKGGYYSLPIKPGLKLVSLNMNYCNNQNWWLLLNSTDPADELTWLINELQMSELKGEKVHIIGHIPPGSNDCLQVWSRNYYRIVNRFEGTIAAQFFGHTHQDEFLVFYDTDDLAVNRSLFAVRPTNVAYVGPSVTTYGGVNPGYRIYHMSTNETKWPYTVVDHETYYLNLTQANSYAGRSIVRSASNWQYSYSPLKDYGMANLDPISWHQLVLDMVIDEKLFDRFYRNYFNKSDAKYKNCSNEVCKMDLLCRLISAHSHDPSICNKLLAEFNKSLL